MMRNVFLSHVVLPLVLLGLGLAWATQHVAQALGHAPQLGEPWLWAAGVRLYAPWSWLLWALRFERYAPRAFEHASWVTYGTVVLVFGVQVALAAVRFRKRTVSTTSSGVYGTARWARDAEVEAAGLLGSAGVVLCQTADAAYERRPDGKGSTHLRLKRPGRLVVHDGPEHVLCFAPTRSGKGVGLVIPTLLTWTGSAVIYDIKKELWLATSGWRRTFSHCWRFEPTAPHSARFNPLSEVRRGDNEVRDVQNIADLLVDPDGTKETRDHWQLTAHSLLVGTILHVLYAEDDKTLSGVARFLSDPERSQFDTLERMRCYPHLGAAAHPVVAATAREMLNKSDNELSGVFSTAMACLGLYRDPLISRNTAVSDFRIADLVEADSPASLYLVVPPSDIERTKPLMRLLLNQVGRRLTEKLDAGGDGRHKHRLLLMLDEFPTLGRLKFFETALAYLAGYGIKAFLIAQSLNQLEAAYGQNCSILDNAHVRITYGANDERTAKRISDLLGQATETKRQVNFSGKRLAGWLGNVSESEQEHARPLLTPGEVLQLPQDDALLLVGGLPPYRGKKVRHFLDRRFGGRVGLPPPESPKQQAREFITARPGQDDWRELSSSRPAPAAEEIRAAHSATPVHRTGTAGPAESNDADEVFAAVWDGFGEADGDAVGRVQDEDEDSASAPAAEGGRQLKSDLPL